MAYNSNAGAQEYKLADYFAVIGLDEDLNSLDSQGNPSGGLSIEGKVPRIFDNSFSIMELWCH
jgi:hypothetical protein